MSTYVALLEDGREEEVTVRRDGPGRYEVRLRGAVHVVDAFRHDYGTLSLVVDTASYSAMLDWRDTKVNVRLRDVTVPLELLDARRLQVRRLARRAVEGRQAVVSPLPARVAKVLVRVGDAVEAGQPLVVIEALDMENELGSPKDGRVVAVHVTDGQAVRGGARLCEVE